MPSQENQKYCILHKKKKKKKKLQDETALNVLLVNEDSRSHSPYVLNIEWNCVYYMFLNMNYSNSIWSKLDT